MRVAYATLGLLAGVVSLAVQAAPAADPKTNYTRYCASCHGFDGRGVMPTVPNLKIGNALYKPEQQMVEALKRGSDKKPPFIGMMSDRELADLINYIRMMP